MANICSFDMIITLEDNTSAERIYTELSRLSDEASSRHEGMWAGSERYLFDTTFTLVDKDVHAVGRVKWGFSDEEVVALIKFLHNITPLKAVQISYEECGNLQFGEYIFDGQMLFASYLNYFDLTSVILSCDTIGRRGPKRIRGTPEQAYQMLFDFA